MSGLFCEINFPSKLYEEPSSAGFLSGKYSNTQEIITDLEEFRTANLKIINNLFNVTSRVEDENVYSSLHNYMKNNTDLSLDFQGRDTQIKNLIELQNNMLFFENLNRNNREFLNSLYYLNVNQN